MNAAWTLTACVVIQGQADADAKGKLSQAEISKTVEFCFRAFAHVSFEEKEALVQKLKSLGHDGDAHDETNQKALEELEKQLTPEEQSILKTLKGRRMVRPEDSLNIENFTLDSIDGLAPRLETGNLGLSAAKKAEVKYTAHDALSYLNGEARAAKKTVSNGDTQLNGNHLANGNGVVNGHSDGHADSTKTRLVDLVAADNKSTEPSFDEATRHRLISSLQQSAEDLETPFDTVVRYVDAVSKDRVAATM